MSRLAKSGEKSASKVKQSSAMKTPQKTASKKTQGTPHEARLRHQLDRQFSLQQRMEDVRASLEHEVGGREMSPS